MKKFDLFSDQEYANRDHSGGHISPLCGWHRWRSLIVLSVRQNVDDKGPLHMAGGRVDLNNCLGDSLAWPCKAEIRIS